MWLLVALAVSSCDGVQPVAVFTPITDPERLFAEIRLSHRAINLSTVTPYDTFRLVATPLNARGEPMEGLPTPTFSSTDTTRVWVTADGLLQARKAATGVQVIAEVISEENIRHADTAYVNVIAGSPPPLPLAVFSIAPETPEEARWSMVPGGIHPTAIFLLELFGGINVIPSLSLRALDANNKPVLGLEVEYRSLEPSIVEVDRREGSVFAAKQPGTVRIVARTSAFGVPYTDTATFRVTWPIVHTVQIYRGSDGKLVLSPSEVRVRTGGYVFWLNSSTTEIDVKFANVDAVSEIAELCAVLGGPMCEGGDISAFAADSVSGNPFAGIRARRFLKPGIYEYESTLTAHRGRVVVIDDDLDAPNAGRGA